MSNKSFFTLKTIAFFSLLILCGLCLHPTKVSALDCYINSNDPHDFAGLDIAVGAENDSGQAVSPSFSGTTIRIATVSPSYSNSDGSFNSSGSGGFNLFNSNNSGERDTSADFTPKSGLSSCLGNDHGVILSHYGTTDKNGKRWMLDCDYTYRIEDGGPKANPTRPYQRFSVQALGKPDGMRSGGYWTVETFQPGHAPNINYDLTANETGSQANPNPNPIISPANGWYGRITFIYHEPPSGWTLNGYSTVQPSTASPGSTVRFKHSIQINNGPATYDWQIYQRTRPTAYDLNNRSLPSGSVSAKTGTIPNNKTVSITIPPGTAEGTQICQMIRYDRSVGPSGDNTNFETSSEACVTVSNNYTYEAQCHYASLAAPPGKSAGVRIWDNTGNVMVREDVRFVQNQAPNGNGGSIISTDSPSWEFNAKGNTVYVEYWVYDHFDATNNVWVPVAGYPTISTFVCRQATCAISIVGDRPDGLLVKGGTATVYGRLDNPPIPADRTIDAANRIYDRHSNLPANLSTGEGLSITLDGGGGTPKYINSIVAPGGSGDFDPYQITIGDVDSVSVSGYPDYYGSGYIGPSADYRCSDTKPVYSEVELKPFPKADLNDNENPTQVTYNAHVLNSFNSAVPVNISSCIIRYAGTFDCSNALAQGPNITSLNAGDSYILSDSTGTTIPVSPPITAGLKYCTLVNMEYTKALVSGSTVTGKSGGGWYKDCDTVENKPYIKISGADISSGGNYAASGSCTGGGIIAGYYNNTDGQALSIRYGRGSGTEQAAIALNSITGFGTAQTNHYRSPTELAFGGLSSVAYSNDSPNIGGNYGNTHCLEEVVAPTNPTTGSKTVTGPYVLSLSDLSFGIGENKSIFVNGDVFIPSNVNFPDGTWTKDSTNSFILKATGNIYISWDVTSLDGIYIAKNKIYTCSQKTPDNYFYAFAPGSLYDRCSNQLVIHGSFVANKVNFMRTYGSLRDEKARTGAVSCSVVNGGGRARVRIRIVNGVCPPNSLTCSSIGLAAPTLRQTCAAEVFEYTPDMYLSDPKIQKVNNGAIIYDAITSLPPVL